jgi:hypothetical protein
MIGIGALLSVGDAAPVSSPYSVNLNPGSIFVFSNNGTSTSVKVKSTVVSGTGPFTYQWVIDNASISIGTATSADTSFTASGFNTQFSGKATLTVTDTGNGNAETARNINVEFEFENTGN